MSPPALRNKAKVDELSASPNIISAKAISQLRSELMSEFSTLLKSFEERIVNKICEIAAEVSNLRSEVQVSKNKLNAVTKRCESAEFDLKNLRSAFNKIENDSVAADVVVLNVPNSVDAGDAVIKLFDAISFKPIVRKVFRVHSSSDAAKSVPIIMKLNSSEDRVQLFKALSIFRKNNNKQISLSGFGYAEVSNIFVHECLSSINREILQNALRLKRDKLIASAYTIRGDVYVKMFDSKSLKLTNLDDLQKVVGLPA